MIAAYILNNKCIEYLDCISLEFAESIIPQIFSSFEDLANISVIDAEENECYGVGSIKIDNVWYSPTHPRIMGWDPIRTSRNLLLLNSDWTQLTDSPLSLEKKQEWVQYRQQLRDITDSFENAWDVVFPEDPDGNPVPII